MSLKPTAYRNPWTLTVLCLLRQGPMDPPEIRRLVCERKKDVFLDLKRGSMYHAIAQLERAGLIEPVTTTGKRQRGERTDYRLTGKGADELAAWLRELLAKPVHEPSQFFAAVGFLCYLPPADVLKQLVWRAGRLESEIAGLDAMLLEMVPQVGRLVLLESEYTRAMRQAELKWVRSLIEELEAGGLAWDPEVLVRLAGAAEVEHPGSPVAAAPAKETGSKP